jgi:hypothetical protein
MFYIYSTDFINKLYNYLRMGCYISCYVPKSTVKSQQLILNNLDLIFNKEKFKLIDNKDEFIVVFQKKK